MFRNYLAAALRNLARNKLYAALNISGLAVGLAAAALVFLFVRDELSYDKFLPLHERTFLLLEHIDLKGEGRIITPTAQSQLKAGLVQDFRDIEAVTRLIPFEHTLRHGDIEANEKIYWADANVFDVLRLKFVKGDARTALEQPGSIVLTRSMARKYFQTDAPPIGQMVEIDREHPMRVTAVIEDLPSNTHLDVAILASGRTAFSLMMQYDADDRLRGNDVAYTYLRLRPGAAADPIQSAMPSFVERHLGDFGGNIQVSLYLIPIADIHTTRLTQKAMRPGGDLTTIYTVSAIGVLILLVAGINFVNLSTARAARRAVEVGVRKAAGAARKDLIVQFIGESALSAVIAMLGALVLIELCAPRLNSFLDRNIDFRYWSDPQLAAFVLGTTALVGTLAGCYPAFVLSWFSPATVLRSGKLPVAGSGSVRQILVTLQFAVLIGLIIATAVIHRQAVFAMNDGMRLDKDAVLIIASTCSRAFKDEVRALPGVRAVACSGPHALDLSERHDPFELPNGAMIYLTTACADIGFFELYGLRPLAGRFFSDRYERDIISPDFMTPRENRDMERVVINETALRMMGFRSPAEAIGQHFLWRPRQRLEIIGVVRDISVDAVHKRVAPVVYAVAPQFFRYMSVKLSGREVLETLQAIDRLYRKLGDPKPIERFFLDQHLQTLYLDVTRRASVFATFAAVAVIIACLGLFGLSVFNAERRTKEIGIRKAMGAGRTDVLGLLLWQFTQPVLWANLIAWPAGYLVMRHWLEGFAYHIDLSLPSFLAASFVALLIAWITVFGHAWRVVRTRPVAALRYE